MNKYLEIYNILHNRFPGSKCFLNHDNVFQLLCAVMMSAQTTDQRVNMVTEVLFKKYTTIESLANANLEDVIEIIKPIGLATTKAKNLIKLSQALIDNFNSTVPSDKAKLVSLPGVGVKTANVVLAVGFDIPEIAVDTHVYRVSYRLGFREENDSLEKCENKLKELFPKKYWIEVHHLLILFGRTYCKAIKPLCSECILHKYCVNGK